MTPATVLTGQAKVMLETGTFVAPIAGYGTEVVVIIVVVGTVVVVTVVGMVVVVTVVWDNTVKVALACFPDESVTTII